MIIIAILMGFVLIGPMFMLMTIFAIRHFNPDSILCERPVYYKVVFGTLGVGILVAIITFLCMYLMST